MKDSLMLGIFAFAFEVLDADGCAAGADWKD